MISLRSRLDARSSVTTKFQIRWSILLDFEIYWVKVNPLDRGLASRRRIALTRSQAALQDIDQTESEKW
jgi:hypothetical protein